MPTLFCVLGLIGLLAFIRHDSPAFYLYSSDKDNQAKRAIHQMYNIEGSDLKAKQIAAVIKSNQTTATNTVTLKEAFFTDEKYMRASWVSVLTLAFLVFNGYIPTAGYANNLFSFFLDNDTFINPRQAVYIYATTQLVGSLVSMWSVSYFNRRTLMLFGHMACFVTQVGLGVLIMLEWKVSIFLMANVFCFAYNVSNAAVCYLYCNEISTDIAMAGVFVSSSMLSFVQNTIFFDSLNLLECT